jgi:hypothetical protein
MFGKSHQLLDIIFISTIQIYIFFRDTVLDEFRPNWSDKQKNMNWLRYLGVDIITLIVRLTLAVLVL